MASVFLIRSLGRRRTSEIVPVIAMMLATSPASAARLPHIFGDHMVLQANSTVPVWGWGNPGEPVTVEFAGQRVTTVTASNRRWRVNLKPLAASRRPAVMTVTGDNRLIVSDVLVGQVWLASGQSNMEKPLGGSPGQQPTTDYEQEIVRANYPTIRLFKVERASADKPAEDVEGRWVVCSTASLTDTDFSAVGYYFARRIRQGGQGAVGMIQTTVGGTRIEPWIAPATFEGYSSLKAFADAARTPGAKAQRTDVSRLWNAMVAPLAPFAVAGAIWYQGESNAHANDSSAIYADKVRALVSGWRAAFERPFSFYQVQIAPYRYYENRGLNPAQYDSAAQVREGQALAAAAISDSGLVVTSDLVDDLNDIHPLDKRSVGMRLANVALVRHYGQKNLEAFGPNFAGATGRGGQVTVRFDHGAGLHTVIGDTPTGFELAGPDGRFYPAVARIDVDRVILSSRYVDSPATVRFGWSDTIGSNLANGAALPAAPFAARPVR